MAPGCRKIASKTYRKLVKKHEGKERKRTIDPFSSSPRVVGTEIQARAPASSSSLPPCFLSLSLSLMRVVAIVGCGGGDEVRWCSQW
jgi:hypothetical protein